MSRIRGFPPLVSSAARLLILGSMPGRASLEARQYYAHPQNAFWPIMGALAGADPGLPYAARIAALTSSGIALWDVLASCERKGSLDAEIHPESMVANDFATFFAAHPKISAILFNGGAAETSFQRHVVPLAGNIPAKRIRLPSTSPAHASLTRAQKRETWRGALEECGIHTLNAGFAQQGKVVSKSKAGP